MPKHQQLLYLITLISLLLVTPALPCTIAVISGDATPDGRPLLWKNRDVNGHDQEVRYFTDGSRGGYLALVTTGENETTTSYVGLNEAGFAIMNSVSPDLSSGSPSSHGILMKLALRECGSVAEFESLLETTAGDRGHIWTNFGVIDALGAAAIFETTDTDHVRYDAADGDGYVVRANNSISGGGDMGSRYFNANQLIGDAALAGALDHEYLIRAVARDLGGPPSMPCGQWPTLEPALNRYKTRSSVVVHGIGAGEDPRLSTFWCTLGEPSCGVSIPLWACAGTPPLVVSNPGHQAALCGSIQEKKLYCYNNLDSDTTIDTVALVGEDGLGGIQRYTFPLEDENFAAAAAQLSDWRQAFPTEQEIAQFQSIRAERTLYLMDREATPGEMVVQPAADIAARPGDREVALTWTDPIGDLVEVEIWRSLWSDGGGNSVYPLYQSDPDAVMPIRPPDRSAAESSEEWILLTTVAPGVEQHVDAVQDRGVYHYEIFARDAGYTYSSPALAGDRSTNYWLGDVSGDDGYVDVVDITILGSGYGRTEEQAGFLPICDVGPTDDWSRLGVPIPDGSVDFNDLMIFSMNVGVVSPLPIPPVDRSLPLLAWEQVDDTTLALRLIQPCPGLKGVELVADLPAGSVEVTAGTLLAEQAAPVFLQNIDERGLAAGLAVLGGAVDISGSGELLRITGAVAQEEIMIFARDYANGQLPVEIEGSAAIPNVPSPSRLLPNHPNPFNPTTEITFSLAGRDQVSLNIFDSSGRQVRSLLAGETYPAGMSSVIWDGLDDAGDSVGSGIYLYRLRCGSTVDTRKMTLLK
ncbi:MAG: hypothetical protein GY835_16140 [bacterium]|nr:hypothetical protein [bacterium]